LLDPLEENYSKAGFYHDLKFLILLAYTLFFLFTVLSGNMLLTKIHEITLIFISLLVFLDLQEFVEIRVSRYGWKCSRFNYRLASAFLVMGVLLVPIADYLMNGGLITKLALVPSIIFFFLFVGFLVTPIIGIVLALTCYLDFARSLQISFWRRDKEIIEAISKHSFFYRKFSRRKR